MEFIDLEVINFEKYNPRKDTKRPHWFAFSNRMIEDAQFFGFSDSEFKAWIYILSQASQRASGFVRLYFEHAQRVCMLKKRTLVQTIEKLEQLQCVRRSVQTCTALIDDPYSTRQDITNKHVDPIDYSKAYALFPRKEGKQRGLEICKKEIKTPEDFEDLLKAITRYKKICEEKQTAKEYIKHFSSFMSSWRDWLDDDAGEVEDFENTSVMTGFADV